jgi:hypothetical protein
MAKVVVRSLKAARSGKSAPPSVGKKRVPSANGGWKVIRTLDANSASFDAGSTYVFEKNVAKARRENKRILGSADVAPRKR